MKINEETLKMLLAKIAGLEERVATLEASQTSLATQVAHNHSQTVVNNTVVAERWSGLPFGGFPGETEWVK